LYYSVQYISLHRRSNNNMAGRPKIYDEEKALDCAIEVFWKRGYEKASAEELLKAMGIGKGSFYLAYKDGKQELFKKSITRFFNLYISGFLQSLKTLDNPIEGIKNFFYLIADPESPIGKYGCYFGNAISQAEDKNLKQLAGQQQSIISKVFTDELRRAKDSGYLKSEISPELLASNLLNFWNGLNVTRNVVKDPQEIKEMIDLNFKIYE
jgi:TetR/AcrR family transcriptional regulator, transcriptional repressor for nem operon